MQTLSRIVTGRRSKWLVLLAWIILAAGLGSFQAKLNSVTQNDSTTFLPANADSTKALDELRTRFDNGRTIPALVVYQNPDGLTDADRAIIAKDEAQIQALASGSVLGNATLLQWITDDENQVFLKEAIEDVRLLLTSGTLLFVELMLIRWIPSQVRYVGFFSNFLLSQNPEVSRRFFQALANPLHKLPLHFGKIRPRPREDHFLFFLRKASRLVVKACEIAVGGCLE
jgi:hypothetical protein